MGKVRQVLNGVSVEEAKRQRICHHNRKKHSVSKGEACLVIRDPSTGGSKNYCIECGNEILDVASTDLDALRADLNS